MKNNINNEYLDLKNKLINASKIIAKQKLIINELQKKLNNYNNEIQNYKNIIIQKNSELVNLNQKLNNRTNIGDSISFNEMMCVHFISTDQKIHYSVPCIGTNTFAEIEEKLYQQYPEYRETNNNFIANGEQVLRFKTIEQNKIGNGFPVTLIVPS